MKTYIPANNTFSGKRIWFTIPRYFANQCLPFLCNIYFCIFIKKEGNMFSASITQLVTSYKIIIAVKLLFFIRDKCMCVYEAFERIFFIKYLTVQIFFDNLSGIIHEAFVNYSLYRMYVYRIIYSYIFYIHVNLIPHTPNIHYQFTIVWQHNVCNCITPIPTSSSLNFWWNYFKAAFLLILCHHLVLSTSNNKVLFIYISYNVY